MAGGEGARAAALADHADHRSAADLPPDDPPLAGQFISTVKDSAIVSVISIQELTLQGMELMAATYPTFEIWLTVAALYFLLTYSCSVLARGLERKMRYVFYLCNVYSPKVSW